MWKGIQQETRARSRCRSARCCSSLAVGWLAHLAARIVDWLALMRARPRVTRAVRCTRRRRRAGKLTYTDKAMGTFVTVWFWTDKEADAAKAAESVFKEMKRLDAR
jgi:hypothetical protein